LAMTASRSTSSFCSRRASAIWASRACSCVWCRPRSTMRANFPKHTRNYDMRRQALASSASPLVSGSPKKISMAACSLLLLWRERSSLERRSDTAVLTARRWHRSTVAQGQPLQLLRRAPGLACQRATPAGGHRRREPSGDVRSWIIVETLPHAAE
jgi:hypothetical protein